jgi:hypothetical protein
MSPKMSNLNIDGSIKPQIFADKCSISNKIELTAFSTANPFNILAVLFLKVFDVRVPRFSMV